MPISWGVPIWTGAPWVAGNLEVTCTARTTWDRLTGRMLTTMGPENMPAGVVAMLVIYMATLLPVCWWRSGMPASTMAVSNEKLQPSKKETKSSRQ